MLMRSVRLAWLLGLIAAGGASAAAEPAPFTPPPSRAKPGILSTIKSKPKAGRK